MDNPYKSIPQYARWRTSVGSRPYSDIDPATTIPFKIRVEDKVATGGSCFAQHVSRHLRRLGLNFYVCEPGHNLGSAALAERHGYGIFSARYGNIYTSRQLLQLFERAFGQRSPAEAAWRDSQGRLVDPFRPTVQLGSFYSEEELEEDRGRHLQKVRLMFETLDYFVFTLGLTECWMSLDGTVFPICPGVKGGIFDPSCYQFKNLTFVEVRDDLSFFIEKLRNVNPSAKIILTVSPVPLAATAEDRHVMVSNAASKAILRAACDELERAYHNVVYFPAYEIIVGNAENGGYFSADRRSVREDGVGHVMRVFERHLVDQSSGAGGNLATSVEGHSLREIGTADYVRATEKIVQVLCDEASLDAGQNID